MTERDGWEVEGDELYESFPIFSVRKSIRRNPRNGKSYPFVLMEGLDWCNVIALTPGNDVVMIRQYRHGAETVTLEIPGGCVEKGERPQDAAVRELSEETGYRLEQIEPLGWSYANPAMQSMKVHYFLARQAAPSQSQSLDAGEDIKVQLLPLGEALAMVQDQRISHALVVAAFGLLALKYPELVAAHR